MTNCEKPMETLGSRLKKLRLKRGFSSQVKLGKAIGVSGVTVAAWEKDEYEPSGKNIENLYHVLKTNSEWLRHGRGDQDTVQTFKVKIKASGEALLPGVEEHKTLYSMLDQMQREYPVMDWAKVAQKPESIFDLVGAKENHAAPIPCGPGTFILKVKGASMEPEFKAGDLIYIDPQAKTCNKDYVIAKMDVENEVTFKQLIVEDGRKYLKAINPDWPQKITQLNDHGCIVGKVIGKWVTY